LHLINYVGGTNIFDRRAIVEGLGSPSKFGVINLGDSHLFMGNDDFYSFDGIQVRPIGQDIRRWFFSQLNPSYYHNIRSFFIEEYGLAIWMYPSVSSTDGYPDKAVVFEVNEEKWTERTIPATGVGYYQRDSSLTYDQMTRPYDFYTTPYDSRQILANFPLNLFGTKNGEVFILDESETADGATITAELIGKEFDQLGFASDDKGNVVPITSKQDIKYIDRVWFLIGGVGIDTAISVWIGGRDLITEDITWHGPYTLLVNENGEGYVNCRVANRLLTLKLQATADFDLQEYRWEFETGGTR
jgi:hypothetical protein